MTRFCSSHVDEGVEDPSKESEGPELWQPLLLAAPVNHEAAANVLHFAAASGILLQPHVAFRGSVLLKILGLATCCSIILDRNFAVAPLQNYSLCIFNTLLAGWRESNIL